MKLPPLSTSPTCHGYSFASVISPPTILLCRLAKPHLQSELPSVVVVVGVVTVVGVVGVVTVVGVVGEVAVEAVVDAVGVDPVLPVGAAVD